MRVVAALLAAILLGGCSEGVALPSPGPARIDVGPLVVNVWASWCGPCRTEMPILQKFHEQHGDRVAVLGIDYEDPQTVAAMELVEETGVTYPLLADPQSDLDGAAPFPSLSGLPFLAFVDAEGRVVHREFVVIESEQQLLDLVDRHLGIDL